MDPRPATRWREPGRHGVDAGELDSGVLNAFLADHVDWYGQLPSAGVMPLLDHLRSAGLAAAEPVRRCSLFDEFLGEYPIKALSQPIRRAEHNPR
jgi:hypothetical protein